MGASVVSGGDASPVFDPTKDVLDLVTLAVEVFIVVVLEFAVFARRDARGGALRYQGCPEPVAVIAFVGEQFLGARERGKQQESAFVVAHLAFGEQHHNRSTQPVADGMEL